MNDDCVFCDIATSRAAASFVYRDETIMAFMDLNPVTQGHLLIAPTEHLPDLADLNDDLACKMMNLGRKLGAALRSSELGAQGINLFYADGEVAMQEVSHAHLHVIPRYIDDGFSIDADWSWGQDRNLLDRQASEITSAISDH